MSSTPLYHQDLPSSSFETLDRYFTIALSFGILFWVCWRKRPRFRSFLYRALNRCVEVICCLVVFLRAFLRRLGFNTSSSHFTFESNNTTTRQQQQQQQRRAYCNPLDQDLLLYPKLRGTAEACITVAVSITERNNMCSDVAAISYCCTIYSVVGALFTLFVGVLISQQPFFIGGLEDVDKCKDSAFGAMWLFIFTFVVSLAVKITDSTRNRCVRSRQEDSPRSGGSSGYAQVPQLSLQDYEVNSESLPSTSEQQIVFT